MIGGGVFSLCFAYNISKNIESLDGVDPSALKNWEIYEASQVYGGLA